MMEKRKKFNKEEMGQIMKNVSGNDCKERINLKLKTITKGLIRKDRYEKGIKSANCCNIKCISTWLKALYSTHSATAFDLPA